MTLNNWVFSYAKIMNPRLPTCNAWHHADVCIYDETNYTLNPSSTELNREAYSDDLDQFWTNKSVN